MCQREKTSRKRKKASGVGMTKGKRAREPTLDEEADAEQPTKKIAKTKSKS